MSEGNKKPEIESRAGADAETARKESAVERMLSRRADGHDPGGCPDAEIVAAYLDQSLDEAAYARCEEHFSNCSRCQSVLTSLAASESAEIPAANSVAAPVEERPAFESAGIPAPLPRRRFCMWLVPSAVAAAAVLIWIDVRPKQNTVRVPTSVVALNTPAQNALPPAPSDTFSPATPNAESKSAPANSARARANANFNGAINGAANTKKQAPSNRKILDDEYRNPPTSPLVSEALKNEAALEKSAVSNELPPPMPLPGQPAAAPPASAAQAGGVGGAAGSSPSNQNFIAGRLQARAEMSTQGRRATQRSDSSAKAESKNKATSPLGALSETVIVESGSGAAVLVTPTNGGMLWRVGAHGQIERSTDSGNTWKPSPAGVTTDLLAGAAPSDGIAWIVGTSGTVLRTTDAGANWTHVKSPAIGSNQSPDWSNVVATDANHATISAITGQSFTTSDGGATWVPKQ